MSMPITTTELLVDLSTAEQQIIAGGQRGGDRDRDRDRDRDKYYCQYCYDCRRYRD